MWNFCIFAENVDMAKFDIFKVGMEIAKTTLEVFFYQRKNASHKARTTIFGSCLEIKRDKIIRQSYFTRVDL